MSRKPIKEGGMPHDFNKAVLREAGLTFSSAYVTMVHNGKRSNKAIYEAIKRVKQNMIFV